MRPVVLVFVFFAVMMALLAAYLAKVWLDSRAPVVQQVQVQSEPTGMVQVLVAARPIAVGTKLAREDFKWAAWPESSVEKRFIDESKLSKAALDAQQQAATAPITPVVKPSADKAEGVTETVVIGAIARRQILEGEPIGVEAIIQPGDHSVVAAVLGAGMRAISFPIQAESAAAGFINPGDHVDVLLASNVRAAIGGTGDANGGSKKDDVIINWSTETVLHDVKVLAIDQQLSHDSKDGPAVVGKMATVEVTPADAERLLAAQQLGALSLVLRSMVLAPADATKTAEDAQQSAQQFTSDKEVSKALAALAGATPPKTTDAAEPPRMPNITVRINRGGALTQQSF
jgi:pilus assembly protein CpaB